MEWRTNGKKPIHIARCPPSEPGCGARWHHQLAATVTFTKAS